jgi:hypothetical protein
VEQEGAVDVKN